MLPRTRTDAPTLSQKMVLFPLEFSLTHARARSLLSVCLSVSSLCSCVCLLFLWLRCRNYGKGPIRDPDPTRRRKNFTSSRRREQTQQLPSERASEDGSPSYLLKLMTTTTTSWLLSVCVCIFLPRNLIEWTGDGTSQPASQPARRRERRRRNWWSFVALGEQPPERWSTERMLDGGA